MLDESLFAVDEFVLGIRRILAVAIAFIVTVAVWCRFLAADASATLFAGGVVFGGSQAHFGRVAVLGDAVAGIADAEAGIAFGVLVPLPTLADAFFPSFAEAAMEPADGRVIDSVELSAFATAFVSIGRVGVLAFFVIAGVMIAALAFAVI